MPRTLLEHSHIRAPIVFWLFAFYNVYWPITAYFLLSILHIQIIFYLGNTLSALFEEKCY